MPGANELELERIDRAIKLQLDMLRHSSNVEAKVLRTIEELRKELIQKISTGDATEWGKARLNRILRDADQTISEYYAKAQEIISPSYSTVARISASQTAAGIAGSSLPTKAVLESIVKNVAVEGSPMTDWWSKMSTDTSFRFSAALRQGIIAGDTQQQLFKRVNETVEMAGRNSKALIHTSISQTMNDATLAVLQANADIAPKLRWLATLDKNTCIRCAPRDGLEWDAKTLEPIGHNIPFENIPLHVGCRCTIIGITKLFERLQEKGLSKRASSSGPVSGTTTFTEFLARQKPEFVEEVLGKKRAELYLAKKLSLRDLISGTGKQLTLEELEAKYDIKI